MIKNQRLEELPGGSVVRTWCFHYWVQLLSLAGDLRSPKPHNTGEKNERINELIKFGEDYGYVEKDAEREERINTWQWKIKKENL